MIRFDTVTKTYRGAPRPALDSVNLEIGAGEFVFLVGASGSGKSSLLRLILREERPSSGEIHVLGQRLTTISTRKVPYFRRSLGVVFQDFRLLPNKTVHDNVAFTLQVLGKSRGFIQTTVPDVLETVGLAEKSQNFPNELSGGEQQRVAIARAVVNRPAILLADEPTGNLDPTTSDGIMAVLERINQAGTTVVMATHDVTIVDRLQKRVVELVGGRIIRDELDGSYVTSSIPLPRRAQAAAATQPGPEVPLWARRGAQPDATEPAAEAEPSFAPPTPAVPAAALPPVTTTTGAWPPAAVPVAESPAGPDDEFAIAAPAAAAPQPAAWSDDTTFPTLTPPSALPTGAPLPPSEATGPVRVVRPTTGPTPVPDAAPIWFRSDTGPVLQPGEHAPWRAAPVAPPGQAEEPSESRSLFFAAPLPAAEPAPLPAPVPAQRGWSPPEDAAEQPAEPPVETPAPRAASAVTNTDRFAALRATRDASPAYARSSDTASIRNATGAPAVTSTEVRWNAAPIDVDDTGDPEGTLRRLGRHRTPPLPDHLDFVTGLGLRTPRSDDDDVGPSS